MQPTRLYLLRHGQTDWNLAGQLQGQTDIPLNDTGRSQARIAKGQLGGVCFDAVYASPLSRTLETAQIASGWPSDSIQPEQRLKEICFGPWEGQRAQDLGPDFAPFFHDPARYLPAPGGESLATLMERTGNFVQFVQQHHAGQTVLAVSHGAALHALLTCALALPLDQFWSIPLGNCSLAILEEQDGRFVLTETFTQPGADNRHRYTR